MVVPEGLCVCVATRAKYQMDSVKMEAIPQLSVIQDWKANEVRRMKEGEQLDDIVDLVNWAQTHTLEMLLEKFQKVELVSQAPGMVQPQPGMEEQLQQSLQESLAAAADEEAFQVGEEEAEG